MARTGGKPRPTDLSAGQIFAKRLAEVRKARGWSQKELAERMTEAGHSIHRVKLAKIEKERGRNVTLEDVLALSYVLGVSPLYMITPLEPFDAPRLIVVASAAQPAEPSDARDWLRGEEPLFGQDPYVFALQMPEPDFSDFVKAHPEVANQLRQSAPYPKEERHG